MPTEVSEREVEAAAKAIARRYEEPVYLTHVFTARAALQAAAAVREGK